MPDMNMLDNGAATGGIAAALIIAGKELVAKWMGRHDDSPVTMVDVMGAVDEKAKEVEAMTKERAAELDKKTMEIAVSIKEKADAQDIKIALLEHQKSCISEMKAETKEFQSQILMSFSNMQTSNQESFRRVHQRMDELKDTFLRK